MCTVDPDSPAGRLLNQLVAESAAPLPSDRDSVAVSAADLGLVLAHVRKASDALASFRPAPRVGGDTAVACTRLAAAARARGVPC